MYWYSWNPFWNICLWNSLLRWPGGTCFPWSILWKYWHMCQVLRGRSSFPHKISKRRLLFSGNSKPKLLRKNSSLGRPHNNNFCSDFNSLIYERMAWSCKPLKSLLHLYFMVLSLILWWKRTCWNTFMRLLNSRKANHFYNKSLSKEHRKN